MKDEKPLVGFRSGSPKSDYLGFIGTTLGKNVAKEAKKATEHLHSVSRDMTLDESIKWLKVNYPNLDYVTVRPDKAKYIRNRNTPFPNVEKEVVIG